ncbi:MAG: DUF4058 family protein [Chloroflexia bacterium]
MESPFPGMDPYLEAPGLWPDVYNSLIFAIREQLQPRLSPRYIAVTTPYVVFESLDIVPARTVIPDVGIMERTGGGGTATLTAIASPPLVGQVALEVPTRYSRIEIRTIAGETLVTAIELLSPANKRPGAEGAEAHRAQAPRTLPQRCPPARNRSAARRQAARRGDRAAR